MKTTIDLPDELFREVKELARSSGVTMRELMVEGLRGELERRTAEGQPKVDFVFHTVPGRLVDGVEPEDMIRISYGLPPE